MPLGERDIIPDCRTIYELQLTYSFSLAKVSTPHKHVIQEAYFYYGQYFLALFIITFQAAEITPNLSLLSDVLYESEFESQLWMLYNSNKQFVACGDAYPSRWSVKVIWMIQNFGKIEV